MSDTSRKSMAVGIVAVVSAVTIGIGVFLVGAEQRLWEGRNSYYLHFARTNGLQDNATVSLDGVVIGRVASMRFPSDPSAQYVEVEIHVSRSIAPRIRTDSIARLQTYGLLGDKYIELTSGTQDAAPMPPGETLRTVDPVDYEQILGQSGDIVADAIEVTRLLRNVLAEIDRGEGVVGRLVRDRELGTSLADDLARTATNLAKTTESVQSLVERIESGQGNFGELVAGENRIGPILDSLADAAAGAQSFADRLNSKEGTIPRLVNDAELGERTIARLERATTSIAEVTEQVRSGDGTLGKLVYDDSLYRNADSWFGGTQTQRGGFWRLLYSTFRFFLPPSSEPSASETGSTAEAEMPGS